MTYTAGDGYEFEQYGGMEAMDYYLASAYFLQNGYVEYCYNKVGASLSSTYINEADDSYATLMYNDGWGELYIGYGKGASNLPKDTSEYQVKNPITTVTQVYSPNHNGMSYIFKLADGSFIIVDGGYGDPKDRTVNKMLANDSVTLFNTLAKLHGKKSGMHVRAWILTHSHNDHYPAFREFAKNYADKITLDYVFYSPLERSIGALGDPYFNDTLPDDVAKFDGATLCGVHTGMIFDIVDVQLEILYAAEMVYKDDTSVDFNESSTVFRVKNKDGGVMILGDIVEDSRKVDSCEWLIAAYGEALKTNIMQVSHHGVNQASVELYDLIAPTTLFWPCNDASDGAANLINDVRGGTTKQHLLCADYINEIILHSYGTATRPISHVAEKSATIDLLASDKAEITHQSDAASVTIKDGVLKYKVGGKDPQIIFTLTGVSTEEFNALRITVKATGFEKGQVRFNCGDDIIGEYSNNRKKSCGPQGINESGYHTMLVFFGNTEDFGGDLTSIRLDFGDTVGEVVEITSAELIYIDID